MDIIIDKISFDGLWFIPLDLKLEIHNVTTEHLQKICDTTEEVSVDITYEDKRSYGVLMQVVPGDGGTKLVLQSTGVRYYTYISRGK